MPQTKFLTLKQIKTAKNDFATPIQTITLQTNCNTEHACFGNLINMLREFELAFHLSPEMSLDQVLHLRNEFEKILMIQEKTTE